MQCPSFIFIASALLAITATAAAPAKGKKPAAPKPATPYVAVCQKYDADKNGFINLEECRAMRNDYTSNPNDPLLKSIDTDHDGTLSDAEIMKIQGNNFQTTRPKAKAKPKPKGKK